MNTYSFDLNLDKKYRGKYIIMRQGDDDSTTLTATLYDQGVPFTESGYTAKFKMTLPDKQHYYRADATYDAGVVTVILDEEYAASYPGRTDDAYFELTKNAKVYSTEPISVVIRRDATDGMTEGKDYDDEIIATINDWLDDHPEATGRLRYHAQAGRRSRYHGQARRLFRDHGKARQPLRDRGQARG